MNDLKCLLSYMRNYAPYNYSINTETDIQGDIDKGKEKFHYLCSRCHGKEGWGEIAPAILNPAFLTSAPASFILQTIKNGRTHSAMFGWEKDVAGYGRQTLKSITNITAFMMSRKDSIPSRIYPGMNLGIPREGRSLFSKKCSTCHGNNGEGLKAPALNNQELLNAASNGFLIATLVLGREGTEMPVWSKSGKNRPALTAEEICHIVAYIRSWQTMTIYLNRL